MNQDERLIKNLNLVLKDKEAKTLLALMRDGRLTDSKLKEILGLRSENAAAHYRKTLEKERIIERYNTIVNWEKLGYKTKFMVLVEGKNKKFFHILEKNHILVTDEYLNKIGELVALPMIFGHILLRDVMTCYGRSGIIIGYATSEEAAKFYVEVYLRQIHPYIKTNLLFIKDTSIKDFFVQRGFIEQYKKTLRMTEKDEKFLEEIRKRIRW